MNVYLYGGLNRFEATKSVVENNEQVKEGVTYEIDYKIGFLLIAYPNEGKDSKETADLEFHYKLV